MPKSLLNLATRGTFLATDVLAILVGCGQSFQQHTPFSIVVPLGAIALAATVLTGYVIRHTRDHHAHRSTRHTRDLAPGQDSSQTAQNALAEKSAVFTNKGGPSCSTS